MGMTTEEKDALVGRTIREEAELEVELAATDKLITETIEALDTYTAAIKQRIAQVNDGAQERLWTPAVAAKYCDLSKLTALVNTRIETAQKLRQVSEILSRLSVRR